MKNSRNAFLATTLVSLAFGLALFIGTGCKNGDTGPVGPQGPRGNANVAVDTFSLSNADWLWNSQYSYSTSGGGYTSWFTRYHDRTDSAVTQGVLDSGMVLVYFTPFTPQPNQWAPLPYSFPSFGNDYYTNYVYETSPARVRLHIFFNKVDNTATPPTLSTYAFPDYKFKIVAVAGELRSQMVRAGVDRNDYDAVMQYLQSAGNEPR